MSCFKINARSKEGTTTTPSNNSRMQLRKVRKVLGVASNGKRRHEMKMISRTDEQRLLQRSHARTWMIEYIDRILKSLKI